MRQAIVCAIPLLSILPIGIAAQSVRSTENVVLVVTDGLRWQEVFGGADSSLLNRDRGGVQDTAGLRREFWRNTPEERRRVLLPFMWTIVAAQGQIYGNRRRGSEAQVTNGLKFSYPGYHEMLAGYPDPRIDRNDFGPNPNRTVFEWLEGRPGFQGRTAALATWDVFADIFNRSRSGVYVRAGWEYALGPPLTPGQAAADRLVRTTTRLWPNNMYDALLQAGVLEVVATRKPRVLFVGYGETDEWAHSGRYDLVLQTAHQVDKYVAELWRAFQTMPEYGAKTTLVITTDHGRGEGGSAWRNHGRDVAGAEDIWIAVLGPDTPPLGEVTNSGRVTQSQLAATVASLVGQDYRTAVPGAAPPIAGAVRRQGAGR